MQRKLAHHPRLSKNFLYHPSVLPENKIQEERYGLAPCHLHSGCPRLAGALPSIRAIWLADGTFVTPI
ncbi:MAG: hypothetical protein OEY56_09540 [Cyclobacteriaceae bacterium]|nr:hypothetical protein [Cyclobacteriaceae bacterium]